MAYDVSEIQRRMAFTLDQSATAPTTGGSEWNVRLGAINRALEEWGHAYDWSGLKQGVFISITGVSQASISLPANFKKMVGFPVLFTGGVQGGQSWPQIESHEKPLYDSTQDYFFLLGSRGQGHTMIWNPGTLASGASLYLEYYSFPSSLASPADLTPVYDPEYLVDRATAYILEARSDGRFQEIEDKAREKLLLMVDNENAKSKAYKNRVETPEKLYYGFRIGRD